MAKAFKILTSPLSLIDKKLGAAVQAIFLITAGVLTANPALIAAGVASGAQLFQKKPSVPGSQVDRLNASIDPRAFRKTVLGSTAMATDLRYQEWYGKDQEFCAWILALASHRIQGVDRIWLNDDLAWTAAGGAQGKYVGYFSVPNVVIEGSAQTIAVGTSGKWNGSARLTGCAYAHFVFRMTGVSKKAESPFSGGIPSRMTIEGRGSPLYDPRRDSTARAGGAGPMRPDDQSTWRYVTDDGEEIGENLALQILRALLGSRINGKLATGCGIPSKRLNLASFAVAANQCAELVNRSANDQPVLAPDGTPMLGPDGTPMTMPGSTTEPRYRGAGVLSEGDDPRTAIDALCAACNGRLRDTGGRLSLVIMHNDLALAAADDGLHADDVVGPFTWNPDPSAEGTPNVVRGKYTDASATSLYQLLPYPDVAIPTNTGIERAMQLDLAVVESPSQAQRIAKQALQRRQYDRTFTAPFDIRAWRYPVGAPVPFTFPPLGFERQLFRVAEQEVGPGGICNMTLSFETEEIYRWDADDRAPVRAAAAITYDPSKAALIQAIDQAAARGAYQVKSQSAAFPITADADTVSIAAYTIVIDDGRQIDLPAGVVDGLDSGKSYGVFFVPEASGYLRNEDGSYALNEDGSRIPIEENGGTYFAQADPAIDAMASSANIFLGWATTSMGDGTYPEAPDPPPSYGGNGSAPRPSGTRQAVAQQ